MSRRGNCYDNAVAERFFQLLKRERIRRRVYADHNAARQDVFEYIEMLYNPKHRHSYAGGLHRYSSNSSISTGSKVSREAGTIRPAFARALRVAPHFHVDGLLSNLANF